MRFKHVLVANWHIYYYESGVLKGEAWATSGLVSILIPIGKGPTKQR